jgi:hypothetical protein
MEIQQKAGIPILHLLKRAIAGIVAVENRKVPFPAYKDCE